VDREHRAFDARRHLRVGDHDGELDDAVALGRQAGHLEIDPDQVVVLFGQAHAGIVAALNCRAWMPWC
jgi:hypothetical protein